MESFTAALPSSQLIVVQDETSPGTLTPKELFNLAWALNYQALFHYGRSAWVTEGLAPAAHVMLLPKGVKPPVGSWSLILLDTSNEEGALGYHEDEQGTEIPYSDVFVKTSREDGTSPVEVASHEMCEMLVDPDVQKVRVVQDGETTYIVEVCDAVQGCGYDVGAPEGRSCGVIVADFCLPAWFGMRESGEQMSFRSSIAKAFELAPQGYISIAKNGSEWTQIFGEQHPTAELPNWASRLPRIHAGDTVITTPCVPLEGREKRHHSDRQLLELLPIIDGKVDRMSDALAGIQATETAEGTALTELLTLLGTVQGELAAKAGQTTVDPAEIASIESDLKAQVAEIVAKLPQAEPGAGSGSGTSPSVPTAPTKTVYTYTAALSVEPDTRFSVSGFETVAVAAVPPTPANTETGATEVPGTPEVPAQPLYYFSGDTVAGEENGATVPGYAVYTGDTTLATSA